MILVGTLLVAKVLTFHALVVKLFSKLALAVKSLDEDEVDLLTRVAQLGFKPICRRTVVANFTEIKGSCYCGANQFTISQPALDTHHCHCSICRRLQGAAFVTLSIFLKAAFRWTKGGDLQTFNSSDKAHRNRCRNCGSPLTVNLDAMPEVIAVSRACIDPNADPGQPAETLRHAFWPDRVPWLEGAEELPKVAGFDK